jgi:DNA repair exonuclease SbcCD ATPase subunit
MLEEQVQHLFAYIKELEEKLREYGKELAKVRDERATFYEKYQEMVKFYDKQVGTPCEEIRHAQEIETYKDHVKELSEMMRSQATAIEKLGFDIMKRGGLAKIDDNNAKAMLYDLDQLGIDARAKDAAELVDARAKIVTLQELNASGKSRMEQLATAFLEQQKEIASLRAKLDGEPCNLDFQKEAAKMSAYADKCLTIKEEAMGHAAAMSNDLTAMGEHAELLTEQLVQAHEKLATANFLADTYKKLYGECYMESGKRNEKTSYPEGDDWP